jgi:hypothetical protein
MMSCISRSGRRAMWKSLATFACVAMLASATAHAEPVFARVQTQYIAALGDPGATSGENAGTWGLWAVDPGPRGVWVRDFQKLIANAGLAPSGWQFEKAAWWVEENGLIMEAPSFPLPAGQYVVTGAREVTSILTVSPPDAMGRQAWGLANGASIYDVTHLRCRAALYSAKSDGQSCSPDKTPTSSFPISPGVEMPAIEGCNKRDFQVLIVIGMMVES